jgi:hypothetical protein
MLVFHPSLHSSLKKTHTPTITYQGSKDKKLDLLGTRQFQIQQWSLNLKKMNQLLTNFWIDNSVAISANDGEHYFSSFCTFT